MAIFKIYEQKTVEYNYEVDAESEDEALEVAESMDDLDKGAQNLIGGREFEAKEIIDFSEDDYE